MREGGIKRIETVKGRSGYDQEGDYFEEKDYDREVIQRVGIKMSFEEAVKFTEKPAGEKEREILTVEEYFKN